MPLEAQEGCLCRGCLEREITAKASGGLGLAVGRAIFGLRERWRRFIKETLGMDTKTAAPGKIYSYEVKTIEGAAKSMAEYKGQVLLIVNTASECGFTPQYASLQMLHAKYKDKGLRVLAFPSNDFGAQEPGADAEIKQFCSTRYNVSFELFSKIPVKGPQQHPLYAFLTQESGHNGAIPWNFSKFLVARDGRVAGRFGPETDPLSNELTDALESLL